MPWHCTNLQNSTNLSFSYFNLGGVVHCLGGLSPPNPPVATGLAVCETWKSIAVPRSIWLPNNCRKAFAHFGQFTYNLYISCDSMYTICSHRLYKLSLQGLHCSYAPESTFLLSTELTNCTFSDFWCFSLVFGVGYVWLQVFANFGYFWLIFCEVWLWSFLKSGNSARYGTETFSIFFWNGCWHGKKFPVIVRN